MSNYCEACGSLKEYAPNFVLNGITDSECKSLGQNKGLNSALSVLHNNCQDLNDMLDCLIGAHQDKLPSYDVCDWKEYINELMSNLYNMEKAMICSECGQWTEIEKLWAEIDRIWKELEKIWTEIRKIQDDIADLKDLVECLRQAISTINNTDFTPRVTNHRYGGIQGVSGFYREILDDYNFDIFMDSVTGDDGSVVADKDYYVTVHMCGDLTKGSGPIIEEVTVHASETPYNDNLKTLTGRHFSTTQGGDLSIGMSASLFVPKGQYLKFHVVGTSDGGAPVEGKFRVHQVSVMWVPAFTIDLPNCSPVLLQSDLLSVDDSDG